MTDEILITGGTLIDGSGSAPQPDTDVLTRGDAIAAIGAAATAAASAGAVRIDATGKTVMPGLIDAHVHCTFDDVSSNDELFFHRDPATAAVVTGFNLPKLLLAGVTSMFDPDTLFEMGPAIRNAVDAGVIEGPRMTVGVQALLTSVGGTAGKLIPDEGKVGYARVVNTTDEMVVWTRRHIKAGADWIKIHATGRIPGKAGELPVWTEDELRVVCETAHDLDTLVTAHCRDATSTLRAARAGVDLILHGSFMDESGLEAVVEAGAALCPTFTFLANLADHGDAVGAGEGMTDIFRGEIEATGEMMRRAFDAGVPILCGSESGFALTPYGHWHAREMEVFVDALGLSPLDAITCATANGAIAMRRTDIGQVIEGWAADLLVVDGDPSTDVTILADRSKLSAVISRGRSVELERPWPTRSSLPDERVASWARDILTRERAGLPGPMGAPT
ncbi:MAG TPA: amidohydrolase family protein [Acidimicrobiales bacterium]|nr:amidohydrolase family protein [Acidimicrobiales bacterium]